MSRGVTEESQFPPFHSCKEWFLGAYVEFDCGSYIVICFSVPVGDAQQSPPAFELEGLYTLFGLCQKGPRLTPVQENGQDKGFVEQEFCVETDAAFPNSREFCHCGCSNSYSGADLSSAKSISRKICPQVFIEG